MRGKRLVQAPTEALANSCRQGGGTVVSSHPREQRPRLRSQWCEGTEVRAWWPAASSSVPKGRGWKGRVGGERGASLQAVASSPSNSQAAAGTGRGLFCKLW